MNFNNNEFLIQELKKGKEKAYANLCDHYYKKLYVYAQTLINDQSLADDIVQQVFIKTWKFRKKLNPEFALQSFLYKSVYNEFLDHYRKNKAVTLLEQKYLESLSQIMDNTDEVALHKMINLVKEEVKKLPPKCQQIFGLSKEEGLTNTEIAAYMDISVKAVEAQITKAYRVLRKKLGEQYETLLFFMCMKPNTNLIVKCSE